MKIYIGKNIRYLRLIKNITQDQLADKLGIAKATVSSYEKSRNKPSVEILLKIASILEVSLDDLFYTDLSKTGKNPNKVATTTPSPQPSSSILSIIEKEWDEVIYQVADLEKRLSKLEKKSD